MEITINGERFQNIIGMKVRREARKTEVRYNTMGDMLVDLVARKYALEVTFGLMTAAELRKLRELSANIYVTVSFDAPEGRKTLPFHISDEPAAEVKTVNGVKLYGGVTLLMKQR